MKFDVYETDDGKFLVYERGDVCECGELPDGKPLFEADSEDDWFDYCDRRSDWRQDDRIRLCKRVGYFPANYTKDLKVKAQELMDRYIAEGKECGWGDLEIDYSWATHTFRAGANWKEDETLYTFSQSMKWTNGMDGSLLSVKLRARDNLVQLWGMSKAVHELGLDLVFDKNFKIHLMGVRSMWKTTYNV